MKNKEVPLGKVISNTVSSFFEQLKRGGRIFFYIHGKETGKTIGFAIIVLLWIEMNPRNNVVWQRKEMNQHRLNSIPAFKAANQILLEHTGNDYLAQYKKRESSNPIFIKRGTQQEIAFLAFNPSDGSVNRAAMRPVDSPYTLIVMDEVIDLKEQHQSDDEEEKWRNGFTTNASTLLRGNHKKYDLLRVIIVLGNSWASKNFIKTDILDKVPVDLELLSRTGLQETLLKEMVYAGIQGVFISRGNILGNQFIPEEEKALKFAMKYKNEKFFNVQWLGQDGTLADGIYGAWLPFIKNIDQMPPDYEIEMYRGGVDYGTTNDKTTAFLQGFTLTEYGIEGELSKKQNMILMAGMTKTHKENNNMNNYDFYQATLICNFYEQAAEKFPDIKVKGVVVRVDAHAKGFRQMLWQEAEKRDMSWLTFTNSSKITIDKRIPATRLLMESGRVYFMKDIDNYNGIKSLYSELSMAQYNQTGNRKDKNNNCIDGWEYSWISDIQI